MSVPPEPLPERLYDSDGARELDRVAIESYGQAGETLMQRAGEGAWRALRERWPLERSVAVLCGPGNNGGDGYVIARLALGDGWRARVFSVGQPHSAEAQAMRQRYLAAGGEETPFEGTLADHPGVIVDALLGTGVSRAVEGAMAEAIAVANASDRPVVAVDVPSGLDATRGVAHGVCVQADLTVTFIGHKLGLVTGHGPAVSGVVVHHSLGIPEAVYDAVAPVARRIAEDYVRERLPRRQRDAHKGSGGHVLIIGGDHGMSGAARMAGEAAARAGAGLVSVATRQSHASVLNCGRPELMVSACESRASLSPWLARATVVAIGPGLGSGGWGREMLSAVLDRSDACSALVVDADALNILAVEPAQCERWILTPHPGEAARLLGCSTAEVQADRLSAAGEIASRFSGVCVLKGAGTVVSAKGELPRVCDRGNPGMASGGMGDVLTGVIAGLRAQHVAALDAATLGVWLHAVAGDRAAATGGAIGTLATDLMPHLRALMNGLHS